MSSSSFQRQRSIYTTEDRIVLDLGSLYWKCGFSGEPRPRHILPTRTVALAPGPAAREGCCSPGTIQPLWDLNFGNAHLPLLRNILARLLRELYHRYLLIDSKARKVVLCEGPLFPTAIKQVIADILFRELEVPSINFVPASVAALLTGGNTTGLVVDCGNLETTALLVYDGRALIYNVQSIPLAGSSVTKRLRTLLKVHGKLVRDGQPAGAVPEELLNRFPNDVWEEMKVQMCVVGERPIVSRTPLPEVVHGDRRLRTYESAVPESSWTIDGRESIVIPGWVRERAAEVLFEGDEDVRSISTAVADALLKCNADLRTEMAQSIVLIGGTSMLPGFSARLMQDLRDALESYAIYSSLRRLADTIQCRQSVFAPGCAAWVGGSLMGALKITSQEVTRTSYLENPELPDWSIIQSGPVGR
ncbi:Actin- protein 10 [Geranomyces variabilis]|nr:Actin- protein 10 [Geranomyces variabilis]